MKGVGVQQLRTDRIVANKDAQTCQRRVKVEKLEPLLDLCVRGERLRGEIGLLNVGESERARERVCVRERACVCV